MAVGIAASGLFGLEQLGVTTVGGVPRDLPSLVWPHLGYVGAMWPGAIGIALMSFTESIAAARAFANSGEPRPVPNQELLALGAANIVGGFFGAMPAGGGTTQTAVNRSAGARTQVAELVTAAAALATLLLLAPLIGLMPNAVLAAVVIVYSVTLIKPAEFREIARVRAIEFRWALIAFGGVVLLGTLRGILVAVIISLLALAYQAYRPRVYVLGRKRGTGVFRPLSTDHPDDETWPGLLLLRPEGRIFFANAEGVFDRIWQEVERSPPSVVAIDGSAVFDIEYTALKMLAEVEERLRLRGVALWLVGLNRDVLAVVQRTRLGETLGRERMFLNRQAAVEKYLSAGSGRQAAGSQSQATGVAPGSGQR